MIHLRIVAPSDSAEHAVDLLTNYDSACNVVWLKGAAYRPEGDVVLVDVAREDASVVLSDLRELDIDREGSIAMEVIDTAVGDTMDRAEEAAQGPSSDGVVWEEVESRTSENAELSTSFLAFMVLATLIAACGIYLDSPILVVGAMVVGPEFGPLAGLCVALVQRRRPLATRSANALLVGFPIAMAAALAMTMALGATGLIDETFSEGAHELTGFIYQPDVFSFIVAVCAGTAGVLSLTSAKSGALIGVLISVTTIPAAAGVSVALGYGEWGSAGGAALQLLVNVVAIVMAGVATLWAQRLAYRRRRREHLLDPSRAAAGLPLGHSRRGSTIVDKKTIARMRAQQAKQERDRRRTAAAAAVAPTDAPEPPAADRRADED